MSSSVSTVPSTIRRLRLATQAMTATTSTITGQGVFTSRRPVQIRKVCSGVKKASIASPYWRVKARNVSSIAFLSAVRLSSFICGKRVSQCIVAALLRAQDAAGAEAAPAGCGQSAPLILAATSGETHFVHTASSVLRKCLAPSSPVAWLSVIHAISFCTVSFDQARVLK